MAVYKVIQDVEAEDKLVGFLTLRTFIYAIIAASLAYLNFRIVIMTQLGPTRWFILLLFLFPMLLFGVLSLPLGKEQPTEIWLLSRVRFFIKARTRVWDKSGINQLVTITVPKKIERHLVKDLNQKEVNSRLKALASTLDSRGWAVKHINVNLNSNPGYFDKEDADSDRLVSASSVTQDQPIVDIQASEDIMDEQNNPTAQKFEALMQKAATTRKKEVQSMMKDASQESIVDDTDYEFLDRLPPQLDNQGNTTFVSHKIVAPVSGDTEKEEDDSGNPTKEELAEDEKNFLEREHKKAEEVHARSAGFKPKTQISTPQPTAKSTTMTTPQQTAKLEELAQSGNDLSVASVAHLANREGRIKQIGPNEVEIDLH
jgi:hypothetical protein